MKKSLLFLCLLCGLGAYSQVGDSSNYILNRIKNTDYLHNVQVRQLNDGFCITVDYKEGSVLGAAYFFTSDSPICYKQNIICENKILNSTVVKFNKDYVALSDLKWKDYTHNQIVKILKTDEEKFIVDVEMFK